MVKLSRFFSITSLVTIVIAALLLGWIYRIIAVEALKEQGEQSNAILTKAFSNAVWPEMQRALERSEAFNVELVDRRLKQIATDTPVLKIKIFNSEGVTIYSTDPNQIGDRLGGDSARFKIAKNGKITSHLGFIESFTAISGVLNQRHILSSYVPLRDPSNGFIKGVVESYTDVTNLYERIGESQFNFVVAVVGIFGIMYIILFFIVQYADKVLSRHADEKEYHLLEIEKINYQLEQNTLELEKTRDLAMAANKAKSDFLANMSHEIRTPLTAIIGYSESIQEDDLTEEEQKEFTHAIIRSSKHLLRIIDDILDLSKVEANKVDMESIPVSPFHITEEVRSLLEHQAELKNIKLGVDYALPIPDPIHSDPVRIKQILFNLCNNAIKFTHTGGVQVRVYCDTDFSNIYFEIEDTGIGLTEQEIDKLFQPFSQADTSTTRRYGGTGLGLVLSKELAERLGGTVTVTSIKNKGSRFIASLSTGYRQGDRLVRNSDEIVFETVEEQGAPTPTLRGNILLAEDNKANQRLISHYVKMTGADLTMVDNGKQAVEEAIAGDFDLVLMDMQMPVMDGYEATSLLRAAGYQRPIAALTAAAMSQDIEKTRRAGCSDFLAKPLDREQFFTVLSKYLSPADAAPASSPAADNAELVRITREFVMHLPAVNDEMTTAASDQDWETLRRSAHSLKGMGGSYGYPELSRIATAIEEEARHETLERLSDLLVELDTSIQQIVSNEKARSA